MAHIALDAVRCSIPAGTPSELLRTWGSARWHRPRPGLGCLDAPTSIYARNVSKPPFGIAVRVNVGRRDQGVEWALAIDQVLPMILPGRSAEWIELMQNEQALLTIGALSKATGVPADTLRTWERRYGFPVALRTQSGHRRYSVSTLEQLHLVTAALALGHRPCAVLSASAEQLQDMLAQVGEPEAQHAAAPAAAHDQGEVGAKVVDLEEWFERVEHFEGRAFERLLRASYSAMGALPFLERAVAPFLRELGMRWAAGELGVRHEHFASERLREFLVAQWRPLSDSAQGPTYVLACPAGEYHVLGLHLVAATVALTGGRVVLLGANTPAAEIANAATFQAAEGVLLSVAAGIDQARLRAELTDLKARLPETVGLVIGGGGYGGESDLASCLNSLTELQQWLMRRLERSAHS